MKLNNHLYSQTIDLLCSKMNLEFLHLFPQNCGNFNCCLHNNKMILK